VASLTGHIDARGRPVVALDTAKGEHFLALVDTGFNGELMTSVLDAALPGFTVSSTSHEATLAGEQVSVVYEGKGVVRWMGELRRVEVLVSPNPPTRGVRHESDPVAMIGTRLLTPHLLLIDYRTGTVEIEQSKD
jgi:predicted aspartyl protease